MPRYQSAALREERAAAHQALAAIYTTAETENREITAEETAKAARLEQRFNDLTVEVRQLEIVEGYSPEQRLRRPPLNENGDPIEGRTEAPDDAEHRAAFLSYVRTGDASELRAAFATSPAANGGYAVPESWAQGIRDILVDTGAIRSLADVQHTTTGNPINMPIIATQATAGIRAEAGPLANVESEDTVDNVAVGSHEISQLVKASREFLRDGLNVEPWIQRRAAQVLGVKQGALFAVGAGGGTQPRGAVPSAVAGKTAASATAVAYADYVGLYYSVPGPYRASPRCAWLVADTSAEKMRLLKDDAGSLIWGVNAEVGQPDTFMGKPIFTDPFIPPIATGNKSAIFGDWNEFLVRIVGGIEIQMLWELFAGNGQVGFIPREYVDSALLNLNALKTLLHP